MPGSLYAALHRLYGTQLASAERNSVQAAQRRALVADQLLPEPFPPDALANNATLPGLRIAVVGAGFAGLTAAWFSENSAPW